MEIAELLRTGKVPEEMTLASPLIEGIPTETARTGKMPINAEEAGMPSGIKRIASLIALGIIKGLEILLPVYGSESEEGKRVKRAIANLSPLAKGTTADDLIAFLNMLANLLPQGGMSVGMGTTQHMLGIGVGGLEGIGGAEEAPETLEALLKPTKIK